MSNNIRYAWPGLAFGAGISLIIASIVIIALFFNNAAPFYERGYTPTNFHRAEVKTVHNSESILVDVDLGFDMTLYSVSLKLSGINVAPPNEGNGMRAVDFLRRSIEGQQVVVRASHQDEYGRWYAEIFKNGDSINDELVDRGLAIPDHE